LAGCSTETIIEPPVEPETVEPTIEEPAALDSLPKTRSLVAPDDKEFLYSNTGSIVRGPDLEPGDVLYTNKSYHFSYTPTTAPPSHSPKDIFVEATLYLWGEEITSYQQTIIEADCIYTEPEEIHITGNTMYQCYGSSYLGTDQQYHYRYGEHRDTETYNVVEIRDLLTLTGTDPSQLNETATYRLPTTLPDGVEFDGWQIPYDGALIPTEVRNSHLTVMFTSPKIYTIGAHFILPDGTEYAIIKTIDLRLPAITSIRVNPGGRVAPGSTIVFTAVGTNLDNATIQWEGSGTADSSGTGHSFTTSALFGSVKATVRCRVLYEGGGSSGWKTSTVLIDENGPRIRSVGDEEEEN
jgi:hypothetical protein